MEAHAHRSNRPGSSDRSQSSGRGGSRDSRDSRDSRSGNRPQSRGRFPRRRFSRRKVCRFCEEGIEYIDFKNYRLLREFVTERGKIVPRRITGTSAKHQRMLRQAIKRARYMALLSFNNR